MAKLYDTTTIVIAGAGIGVAAYFTDCMGYCTGFKSMVDNFIGSLLGSGSTTPPPADETPDVVTFTPCPSGQYRDATDGTCKTIPTSCAAGTHWDQSDNTCHPDAPVGCGTPETNPGYVCCKCKEAAGRDKCPQGICCAECITQCPSQCKGFTIPSSTNYVTGRFNVRLVS